MTKNNSFSLNETLDRLTRYLESNKNQVRLVNVENPSDYLKIKSTLEKAGCAVCSFPSLGDPNEIPSVSKLYEKLKSISTDTVITGLTTSLKLQGSIELQRTLTTLLNKSSKKHIIILSYQCEKFLPNLTPRQLNNVYFVQGETSPITKIIFTGVEIKPVGEASTAHGIGQIADLIEQTGCKKLYVNTEKRKDTFPFSLLPIEEMTSYFDFLYHLDFESELLHRKFGSDEDWKYAIEELNSKGSWQEIIEYYFSSSNHLPYSLNDLRSDDSRKKWLYFIALKLRVHLLPPYFSYVMETCETMEDVIPQLYEAILNVSIDDPEFMKFYRERKELLGTLNRSLSHEPVELHSFLKALQPLQEDGVYYLTDQSNQEKQYLFYLLDCYREHYDIDQLKTISKVIYPSLSKYLTEYPLGNNELDSYFQEYKYQKVVNYLKPDFLALVNRYANERNYNFWLPSRAEVIDTLSKENSSLYFVDALGVEFLGYINQRCNDFRIRMKAKIGYCNLPSITSENKEFINEFSDLNAVFPKQMDKIKHAGIESLNHFKQNIPIYLIEELEEIDQILSKIKEDLGFKDIQKVFLVSDHGASRLAVINNDAQIYESPQKGEHNGRCCPADDNSTPPEFVTIENNYWSIANYDRFRGSRKATVEVHGGATLEEVLIPVIEFSNLNEIPKVKLLTKTPLQIVRKKKTIPLSFHLEFPLSDLTLTVTQKQKCWSYPLSLDKNGTYISELTDLKHSGEVLLQIFADNLMIYEETVQAEKAGISEKNLF